MKQIKSITFIFFIVFASCNDNTFNKFRNDNYNSGVYVSKSIVKNPVEKWKFKTEGRIHASVAFDGENVFIGSEDSRMYSLNAATGDLNWEFKTGGEIYSTALINGKHIYFLSSDGNFYKLNKNNGQLLWSFETAGEDIHNIKNYYDYSELVPDFWDFYQSSPGIYKDNILFGAGNILYALNKKSGKEVWNYKTGGAVHSSPAIEKDKVVFGSFDSRVYCLNTENGNEIWRYETGRDTAQYVWLGVQASPLIVEDKIYIGSRDAKIYCFNLNTGDTLWTNNNFEMSWMPSSFSDGGELIYSGSSDGFSFYAIEKATGKINYQISTNSYTFSSPAINNTMAYIGSANGRLYGIDLNQKKITWEFKTTGLLTDTLKVYKESGEMDVEIFRALAKEMEVDSYPELCDFYETVFQSVGAILSSPVIHNGTIYFGSCDGYVYAISGDN